MLLHIGLILLACLPIVATLLLAYQTMRAGFNFLGKSPLKSKVVYAIGKASTGIILLCLAIASIFPSFFLHVPFIIQNEIPEVQKLLALVFLGAGDLLMVSGFYTMSIFTRMGLPEGEHALQTEGVFRLSRNPIYTSFLFLFSACFLLVPSLLLAAIMVIALIIHHAIIKKEEVYLEQTFGNEYLRYKKSTARYL